MEERDGEKSTKLLLQGTLRMFLLRNKLVDVILLVAVAVPFQAIGMGCSSVA